MTVHQDAALYATKLSSGGSVSHELAPGRHAWVQVAKGAVVLNGIDLVEGDGAALDNETRLELRGASDAEVLLFDLA